VRELELRLALVCYGGASLAVYMNGISHEILKLVRASRAYQGSEGGREDFERAAPRRPYATDTEALYFDLFQALGKNVDLRVIVDVVSGTSAGGINGIFLARALAHDLDFDPLRNMWLELGDVEELMEKGTIAERFNKMYLYPFIWMFGDRVYGEEQPDAESKRKLSRFLRSRWFKPPFSGERMLKWMINACDNMGKAEDGPTLMPPGHKLDLFVSLTNFYGQARHLKLHDPKEIAERQHKVTLNFSYQRAEGQKTVSDFMDDNAAGLGFAARATSSFPGAFPPIRLKDLDAYLAKERRGWPARRSFLARNFPRLMLEPEKLETMSFIDGGVTNNKPFGEALDAIYKRAAHREVDRRVIYVDPNPEDPTERFAKAPKDIPGFFRTILSSLAEIPRNEPIYGDLRAIEETNKDARRLENVLDTVEVDVRQMVDSMLDLDSDQQIDTAAIASWRERAHRQAQEKAGFGYSTYMQSKVQQILEKLSTLIVEIARGDSHSLQADQVRDCVFAWAEGKSLTRQPGGPSSSNLQDYITFLRTFDVDFRVRRLRFTVKRLNQYLQSQPAGTPGSFYKLTKQQLYKSLEEYRARWRAETFTEGLSEIWRKKSRVTAENIGSILTKIGDIMQLEDSDFISDQFMALTLSGVVDQQLKISIFRAYIGYAFYDILTQPMTAHADLLEVDEIRVDRISPIDCGHLHGHNVPLRGTELFNFGAFFSRSARENDYLWGRIHASNRLVDFILDAAGPKNVPKDFDADIFKKKLINCILDSEESHMTQSAELIKALREKFSL